MYEHTEKERAHSIKRECIREDKVADVVSADRQGVERRGVAVAGGNFYSFEMGIHLHVHACRVLVFFSEGERRRTCYGPMHDRAILELNSDGLVVELHKEADELHGG